jgi:hypothetical protein
MNGPFLQEPPYNTTKQPKKFDKTQCQPLRTNANFDLKICLKRQSSQYKLKEEPAIYLMMHL